MGNPPPAPRGTSSHVYVRCRSRRLLARDDQIGWAAHSATPAVRTPVITNGGRAARSKEFACQRAAAPATKEKGVNHAAKTVSLRGHFVIQAFKTPPMKASARAATGIRTNISDAASKEFRTTNAPASPMPLATKGWWSHDAACAAKARFKVNAKLSRITTASEPHHSPAITANMVERVRCHAAEPAAPSRPSMSSTEPAPRTSCTALVWSSANHSTKWLAMRTTPNRSPVCAPAASASLASGRR